MDLIIHHMLEPLIVGGAKENLGVELASGEPIVQNLIATQVIAVLSKQVRDFLHIDGIVERSSVTNLTLVR